MKIIKLGQEAREALKRGIDIACNPIKTTLGPAGRNAVLGRIDIPPISTNDGVSVARNIEAEDEIENQGVWIVKEACSVASAKGGDGTTTTAVLLQAIVEELFNKLKDDGSLVSTKPNVIELMNEVDKAKDIVVAELIKRARPMLPEEIFKVAKVAGEFDWLAKIVTEIYEKIGKDGYVSIQEGLKTSYKTFKGIEFNAGYQSEYFINNDEQQCVIENPYIFVTNQAMDTSFVLDIIPKLVALEAKGLVLIAPEFSRDMLNRLNTTKLKTDFNVVALKLPTYDKNDLLVDIATLTQAKFFDKNVYTKIEDFIADIKVENLGRSEKIIIGDSKTTIVGGEGDTSNRVETIKSKLENTQSLFDRDMLEKRIAYLSGGIATLTIGGDSDFEKTYFKLKAENAVSSVEKALRDGVVQGGGLTLKSIGEDVPTVISNALFAPYKQIQENAGGKLEISEDVLDAVSVTISSIKSACSLAARVLTTEVVIAFKNKKDETKN